ncbi:Seven in absentia protein family [Popillia japonica]|uniref:Seven in absentia protein family n=1 Tax=Popillia japonica TaxID=7064 RepID=A0AAW1IES0_POPJA
MESPENRLTSCFKCPSCGSHLRPPMMQCKTGHCLCESCFETPGPCQVCSCSKSLSRCFTLEKIFAKLEVSCKNQDKGCGVVDRGVSILKHEAECSYKQFCCQVCKEDCGWVGLVAAMSENKQAVGSYLGNKYVDRVQYFRSNWLIMTYTNFDRCGPPTRNVQCTILNAYSQAFRFILEVDYIGSITKWYVYFVTDKENVQAFTYKIDIKSASASNHLKFSAPVQCINYINDAISYDECIIVHFNSLRQCINHIDLVYTIEILESSKNQ